MTQRFRDHPNAQATNVCLFYGHDAFGVRHIPSDHHQYRMGYREWNTIFPEVIATLRNDPVESQRESLRQQRNRPPVPISFRVYPHLRRSYITEGVAHRFMLENEVLSNNIEPDPIPLPPDQLIIQSVAFYKAYISIECSQAIPEPIPTHPFEFHVLVGVPGEIAIIGRDIIEHMHLLYRGRYNHNALKGSPHRGRFYFGRDGDSRPL